ncbi:Transcription factor BYE1 [Fusarium albosuccineum]|uniref:Transcription factor BYE1 n=1 Tax=Fusarium albosuccineum TaxID=1237068 RepID=A0A8H4LJ08_9HYPO|nr:Transcription factor BYE1 [Fusarium albosuccineum]
MSGKRQRPARSSRRSQLAEDDAPQKRDDSGRNKRLKVSTNSNNPGESEPRRSVRATKGQHTKSFDEIEPATVPKRRQTKKAKKAKEQEQEQQQEPEEEEEDELIRCVCGATEQDEDSGEAWIACETCGAWQHNVCVGVSSFDDEIPEHYWCEQCRPDDHKELLDGMAKGEKPWEARRRAHEEEAKKKKRGGRKGKGKRHSETKDEDKTKAKPSPAPDATKEKKETAKSGKRKTREDSHDTDGKVRLPFYRLFAGHICSITDPESRIQTSKLRRVSENEAVPVPAPVPVSYTPPADLAKSVGELPNSRTGPAKALNKSISHVLTSIQKQGNLQLEEGSTVESKSEAFALQIERAVFDTHPVTKGQKEYSQQIKTLSFNLKNNPELCHGLLARTLSPAGLAVMTSEQLASSEMQKQTAEMKAKAEKQSILYTSETGPRVRRTHKGEEVIDDESFVNHDTASVPLPAGPRRPTPQAVKKEPVGGDKPDLASHPAQNNETQRSPSHPDFDITKVFDSVKLPTVSQNRRPSAPVLNTNGPGVDLDVDRMLQEENESPPYSPTEETQDPDVVWRGSLAMSSIADFPATAKHIGGANFAAVGPWSKLIPKRMTVAGRITEQSAIEYLCSLRYSSFTDIIVVSFTPVSPASHAEFNALVDYFVNKKRYGVIGDKAVGNVRDTYLVPVPPGEDNYPEFMLNLVDNKIPKSRSEPMLLAVFVYRNDPDQLKQLKDGASNQQDTSVQGSPTPVGHGQRSNSTASAGPAFSPATPQAPQGAFAQHSPPTHLQSTTPVPIPQPPHTRPPTTPAPAAPPASQPPAPMQMSEAQKFQAQQAGTAVAQEVLGPLISVPTVQFILPQAYQMSRREWEVVRGIFERDPRSREDLQYLGSLLEKESSEQKAGGAVAS